jgi:DNA-binding transcriptional LysR family regulator
MKIDDIEAFVTVVRCQSISHAAQALELTQPAVTRRIQNFEESLGAVLLDRNTKPPKPTAMGKLVYEQCLQIVREVEALRHLAASDSQPSGSLRLGVVQTVGDVVLLDALRELGQTFPELSTQVSTSWSSRLLERLKDGELDAAIALFPPGKAFADELLVRAVGEIDLVVVARKDDYPKRSYRLRDCWERGWVLNPDGCGFRATLHRLLTAQGLALKTNLEIFGAELQLGLVASGMGLGLMAEPLLERSAYRDQLRVLPISDFKARLGLSLLYPRHVGKLQQPLDLLGDAVEAAFGAAPKVVRKSASRAK